MSKESVAETEAENWWVDRKIYVYSGNQTWVLSISRQALYLYTTTTTTTTALFGDWDGHQHNILDQWSGSDLTPSSCLWGIRKQTRTSSNKSFGTVLAQYCLTFEFKCVSNMAFLTSAVKGEESSL